MQASDDWVKHCSKIAGRTEDLFDDPLHRSYFGQRFAAAGAASSGPLILGHQINLLFYQQFYRVLVNAQPSILACCSSVHALLLQGLGTETVVLYDL